MSLEDRVLVLNANDMPLKVVDWREAVLLVLYDRADMVAEYAGRLVRSASWSMPWPAVVRLRQFVQDRRAFNRANVLARDSYSCCYCGVRPVTKSGKPDRSELTLDHVIPRAQSRGGKVRTASGKEIAVTCWENVVTACVSCNGLKGGRTPEQAKMKLRHPPRRPTPVDLFRMSLSLAAIPQEWEPHIPWGSGDYWTVELDSE